MAVSPKVQSAMLGRFGNGIVPSEIYSDEVLHQAEQSAVFGRSWLFVGHESMLQKAGDFFTTYMGEDPVIVVRSRDHKIRVLLNKCRHRGNKVCLFDRGDTHAFTCSYHGWTYDLEGKLKGVPHLEDAYSNDLDKASRGLLEARCETYGGLVFANWDADAVSLRSYLGDMTWYLDKLFLMEDLGGLEIIPGKQRHSAPINWKLMAENFVGDHYHFAVTHASLMSVLANVPVSPARQLALETKDTSFEITINPTAGVTHSLGQMLIGPQYFEEDLRQAEILGPDAVEWVRARKSYLEKTFRDMPVEPYGFNRFHIFPNFSMVHATSALTGHSFFVWNPRSVVECEPWQWCAVPREAPEVVRRAAVQAIVQGQSVAGMIGTDDSENFSRISDNVKSPVARSLDFDYTMGHSTEGGSHPALASVEGLDSLPGLVGYHTSEVSQRSFLRHWADLMVQELGTEARA